jgi:hypothetical protein
MRASAAVLLVMLDHLLGHPAESVGGRRAAMAGDDYTRQIIALQDAMRRVSTNRDTL